MTVVEKTREMTASVYTWCFVLFGALGTAGLFVLLRAQRWLPGGPDDRYLTTPTTNTAISFATTTTWRVCAHHPERDRYADGDWLYRPVPSC
jgi:K+-transporting ATPase A subunit